MFGAVLIVSTNLTRRSTLHTIGIQAKSSFVYWMPVRRASFRADAKASKAKINNWQPDP